MTPAPARTAREEAILALSHRMDDAAHSITEMQTWEFATELRVLLGLDGEEAESEAIAKSGALEHLREAFNPMEISSWTKEHVINYPSQAQRIINAAVALLAAPTHDAALHAAVSRVLWFDWGDNDEDAAKAIQVLRDVFLKIHREEKQ